MSTRSSRKSRGSRSKKRRVVDFDVASAHSSNLSGFSSSPSLVPTPQRSRTPTVPELPANTGFAAWKSLPDGRYNYHNGQWYGAPWPKYFWSPNTNMYEIIEGKLYSWPDH
jgi:hypothetical protein